MRFVYILTDVWLEHFEVVGNFSLDIPTRECRIETYPRLLIHSTKGWYLRSVHPTSCIKPLCCISFAMYAESELCIQMAFPIMWDITHLTFFNLNIALVFCSSFQIYRVPYSFWQVHLWFVWLYCSLSEIMNKLCNTSGSPCLLALCKFKATFG